MRLFTTTASTAFNRTLKPLIQKGNRSPKYQQHNSSIKHSVLAVCTAKYYDIRSLHHSLPPSSSNFLDDESILHIPLSEKGDSNDAFLFANGGGFVIWSEDCNISSLRGRILNLIRPFEREKLSKTEEETIPYQMTLQRNHIDERGVVSISSISSSEVIDNNDNDHHHHHQIGYPDITLTKLAFSSALIQSVKLETMEIGLEDYISRIKEVPEMLANGRIKRISRHQVLRWMGEVLSRRAELNLHSQLFDVPDLFWSDQELEQCYIKMIETMDVKRRGNIVNKKLDYASDIVSLLRSHLMEEHGLLLEWGIIILITCEVIFGAAHWIEKLYF